MFEIYETYFTSLDVLTAAVLPIVSILALFLIFRASQDPRSRSRTLGGMMVLSVFFWLFIGFSLIVCLTLTEAYEYQPEAAVKTALGIVLMLAVVAGLPLSYLLRRYSPQILLRNAKHLSPPPAQLATTFRTLRAKVGVRDAELQIAKMKAPISFVAETNKPIVVLSERLLSLLGNDEFEAVMAHELAHVKNSDTTLKAMVTAYKAALPHDPFIRLAEAAFHREREMIADETAVRVTEKPLSLASALLKIHRAFPKNSLRSQSAFSIVGIGPSLMNRHPSINDRIEQLVRLAQTKASE
jgi:heat shock protein HtpX